MVYAAWRRKLPAALTEADAHLGLANRLAAPFARRVFLASLAYLPLLLVFVTIYQRVFRTEDVAR